MRKLFKRCARIARCTEGSALLEMTIVFPVLLSLMVGSIDFGRYFYDEAILGKSVRDAGRYLASLPTSIYTGGCPSWATQNATNLVVYGKFPVGQSDQSLIEGWISSGPNGTANNKVAITCSYTASRTTIDVVARAPYKSIALFAVLPGVSILTLSAQHQEFVVSD